MLTEFSGEHSPINYRYPPTSHFDRCLTIAQKLGEISPEQANMIREGGVPTVRTIRTILSHIGEDIFQQDKPNPYFPEC